MANPFGPAILLNIYKGSLNKRSVYNHGKLIFKLSTISKLYILGLRTISVSIDSLVLKRTEIRKILVQTGLCLRKIGPNGYYIFYAPCYGTTAVADSTPTNLLYRRARGFLFFFIILMKNTTAV